MHLKSLTLKGFKSFAQATTFAFEPGVTCIVGPNGSGKSNVVDALAWVMGEQGAKNLRGGSMADVIFAGTATRGPLGRAEVVLTIDNADGALPIEYGEVAISRLLFRDGRSEYAINGEGCRLLDVQELLSDSGLGREMHVIVGQGRLDEVLRANPAERRGFIEEAAGILKHRRRKERTVRKLDAMQANLTRLTDLAEELRRQLKPLGAQAEVAQQAAGIQAEVREARTRLLAHEAGALAGRSRVLAGERTAIAGARQVAEDAERALEQRVARLEAVADGDELDGLRRTALDLRTAQDRLRSLAQTATTRVALLAPDGAPQQAQGPHATEVDAAGRAVAASAQRAAAAEPATAAAGAALLEAQQALAAVEAAITAQTARAAEHDRCIAQATARVAAADGRAAAARADLERRTAAHAAAAARADSARRALEAVAAPTAEAAPDDLPALERAATDAAGDVDAARTALHALERRVSAVRARLAALRSATAVPPSVAQVLGALPGARRLLDLVEVDEPWRTAVEAVLGGLVDAAVVPGDADLLAAGGTVAPLGAVDVVLGGGASVAAGGVVRGPAGVLALLDDVVLVEDLDAARAAATGRTVAVTRAGQVVGATRLRTAGTAAGGLSLAAERDAAAVEAESLERDAADAAGALAAAEERHREVRAALAAAGSAARERERAARTAERERAGIAARAESAAAEQERAAAQVREAEAALAAAERTAAEGRAALGEVGDGERPVVDTAGRAPGQDAVEAAREAVLAARLEQETSRARLRADRDRLAALERRAAAAERAAEEAARREARRAVQREAAEQVAAELPAWLASVDAAATEAGVRVAEAERRRAERGGELRDARDRLAAARTEAATLDHRARDLDMRAYELDVSLAAVRERASAQLGLDAEALAAEHVPGLDRPEEERRLAAAERRLARLGRVNPLALEEFTALEARHAFLADQLADLARTRADLLTIVADLDARMTQTFDAAYADTEAAFARIFPVLFPGGAGRLSLIPGEDGDGVDVSVRPAGKKIERLSLLSGGERSLAAVAFLLAIFTARPSPFYILDEVEAALDDANLGRLLDVVSSLRDASQLILITHQKRTMEIADALYGVSMRQDGVSHVIGQRMAARA